MTVHFSSEELSGPRNAVATELADRGLDGLLIFRQESMYYLTGYDTFGYVFFQCLYLGADGETMTLLTRVPDLRQAKSTSVIEDIRVWYDAEGANPANDLRGILDEHSCKGKRLGIETDAHGLTRPRRFWRCSPYYALRSPAEGANAGGRAASSVRLLRVGAGEQYGKKVSCI